MAKYPSQYTGQNFDTSVRRALTEFPQQLATIGLNLDELNGTSISVTRGESGWTWGKYCTLDGTLANSDNWGRKSFHLLARQKIEVTTYGSSAGIITQTSDGVNFTLLTFAPSGTSVYNAYTYTATEECDVTVFLRAVPTETKPTLEMSGKVDFANLKIDELELNTIATSFKDDTFIVSGMYHGAFIPNDKRVASNTIWKFPVNITLTAAQGFRFGIHIFENGVFSKDPGWQTSYQIAGNTTFKIVIAREEPETVISLEDIPTFVSAVTFKSVLSNISKLVDLELERTLTLNGGQALSYLNIEDYRGEKISVKVTGDFTQFGYLKSDSSYAVLGLTQDVWVTFDVPQDATDMFVFNNTEKGTTTPTMQIRTNFASEVVENAKDIATNAQSIKNIPKLGYCYQGLLSINTSNKTFTTTFAYAGIGKNGFKLMNNVSNKAITPISNGSYNGLWVAFLNWDTVEIEIYMFESIPTDISNRYVVATGFGFDSKCVQFSTSKISPSVIGQDESVVTNTQNIATNTQDIATIKNSLGGILWSNLFEGSDMEKGYNQSNILAFSTYPNIGGTVEKILDDETSRYCIKAHFPAGTEFTGSYVYPPFMKNISFIGEDTTQEFSLSFRYKCSSNLIGFCPLCNSMWMQYLTSNGTWRNMGAATIPLVKDNNWHYAHIITRKTDVANKTYSVGLYAYFAAGSAVTLEEDLDFCITDIVISPSRFPDYSVVRNVNDYLSVDKETLQPTVNEIIKEYPDAYGCVFMSLGDSITTEGYYIPKLRQILQPSKYYNLAVASATWADRSNTTSYDGNPQFQGDSSQNVLGNQVQKIINNPDVYNVAPDIIIIAAGTNDFAPSQQEMEWDTIETYFTQNGGAEPVPCTTPTFDESDTYKDMRKTITGAMRYVCSKLQEMYPKARIYILTPIQGSFNPNKNYNTQIRLKQQHIANVAKHLSLPVIHVGENCGINQDFEYGGCYWKPEWATETHPRNGRDLTDGLHPNTSGSWKMAKYIARELFNNYVNQNL